MTTKLEQVLHLAQQKNPRQLRRMLKRGVPEKHISHALLVAAQCGRLDTLKTLVGAKADLSYVAESGDLSDDEKKIQCTPLALAALHGHIDCVNALLKSKAEVLLNNDMTEDALIWAVVGGDTNCIETILDGKADINVACHDGSTPLMWACAGVSIEPVKVLLKRKADPMHNNALGETSMMWAAMKGNNKALLLLLEKGCNIDGTNCFEHTALTYATYRRNIEGIRLLLDKKASIKEAFQKAPKWGFTEANETMKELGYDISEFGKFESEEKEEDDEVAEKRDENSSKDESEEKSDVEKTPVDNLEPATDTDVEQHITLTSKDNFKYKLTHKEAGLSGVLREFIEKNLQQNHTVINFSVQHVNGAILEHVIDYLQHHNGEEASHISRPLESNIMREVCSDPWDAEFIDKVGSDRRKLYDIIFAANNLNIVGLIHLACAKVASLIKGQQSDTIRELLQEHEALSTMKEVSDRVQAEIVKNEPEEVKVFTNSVPNELKSLFGNEIPDQLKISKLVPPPEMLQNIPASMLEQMKPIGIYKVSPSKPKVSEAKFPKMLMKHAENRLALGDDIEHSRLKKEDFEARAKKKRRIGNGKRRKNQSLQTEKNENMEASQKMSSDESKQIEYPKSDWTVEGKTAELMRELLAKPQESSTSKSENPVELSDFSEISKKNPGESISEGNIGSKKSRKKPRKKSRKKSKPETKSQKPGVKLNLEKILNSVRRDAVESELKENSVRRDAVESELKENIEKSGKKLSLANTEKVDVKALTTESKTEEQRISSSEESDWIHTENSIDTLKRTAEMSSPTAATPKHLDASSVGISERLSAIEISMQEIKEVMIAAERANQLKVLELKQAAEGHDEDIQQCKRAFDADKSILADVKKVFASQVKMIRDLALEVSYHGKTTKEINVKMNKLQEHFETYKGDFIKDFSKFKGDAESHRKMISKKIKSYRSNMEKVNSELKEFVEKTLSKESDRIKKTTRNQVTSVSYRLISEATKPISSRQDKVEKGQQNLEEKYSELKSDVKALRELCIEQAETIKDQSREITALQRDRNQDRKETQRLFDALQKERHNVNNCLDMLKKLQDEMKVQRRQGVAQANAESQRVNTPIKPKSSSSGQSPTSLTQQSQGISALPEQTNSTFVQTSSQNINAANLRQSRGQTGAVVQTVQGESPKSVQRGVVMRDGKMQDVELRRIDAKAVTNSAGAHSQMHMSMMSGEANGTTNGIRMVSGVQGGYVHPHSNHPQMQSRMPYRYPPPMPGQGYMQRVYPPYVNGPSVGMQNGGGSSPSHGGQMMARQRHIPSPKEVKMTQRSTQGMQMIRQGQMHVGMVRGAMKGQGQQHAIAGQGQQHAIGGMNSGWSWGNSGTWASPQKAGVSAQGGQSSGPIREMHDRSPKNMVTQNPPTPARYISPAEGSTVISQSPSQVPEQPVDRMGRQENMGAGAPMNSGFSMLLGSRPVAGSSLFRSNKFFSPKQEQKQHGQHRRNSSVPVGHSGNESLPYSLWGRTSMVASEREQSRQQQ